MHEAEVHNPTTTKKDGKTVDLGAQTVLGTYKSVVEEG